MKPIVQIAIVCGCLTLFFVNNGFCEEKADPSPEKAPLSQGTGADTIAQIKESSIQQVRKGDFEAAIATVESGLQQHPYNFELEVTLAKVLLAQSDFAKSMHSDYKKLVKRPYKMGKQMYKADPYRPDPYFIVARSLIIIGQYQRAGKTIQKALYFARGQHPDLALYYEVLGDAWQGIEGDARAYPRAKAAYQGALYGAGTDAVLKERLERKLISLDDKFGYE